MPREDEYDYRWLRIGWLDQERNCDAVVRYVTAQLPGETMPQRWKESDPTLFVKKHGKGVKWCKTASYHKMLLNGNPILRIWTNAKKTTIIEVNSSLASLMRDLFELENIPSPREFNYRFRVQNDNELEYLVELVKDVYLDGLAN